MLVLSGKLAVNEIANKTSQTARNPQLEWLRKDIALSKFITCSRTLSENVRRELTKHYALAVRPQRIETAIYRLLLCIPL